MQSWNSVASALPGGNRKRFQELDEHTWSTIEDAVRDGIDAGYFGETDPETVARFVVTMTNSAHIRGVALGEPQVGTRYLIEDYLEQQLSYTSEGIA